MWSTRSQSTTPSPQAHPTGSACHRAPGALALLEGNVLGMDMVDALDRTLETFVRVSAPAM